MLDSNLSALAVAPDEDALERLAPLREDPAQYWGLRSSLGWN
jgi:hypothetical protein